MLSTNLELNIEYRLCVTNKNSNKNHWSHGMGLEPIRVYENIGTITMCQNSHELEVNVFCTCVPPITNFQSETTGQQ